MNLDALFTRTTVSWMEYGVDLVDKLIINGISQEGENIQRVSRFLDLVRLMTGQKNKAEVRSVSNFPLGVGIASSSSAFAALSLAATRAAGLHLDSAALSRLARHGSGSACRSIPAGYVEWTVGENDETSYAATIVPPEHWSLVDVIAIVSDTRKSVGSSEGHALAGTSPLQDARISDAPRRLGLCRQAIIKRDFQALSEVIELDSNLMHAIMMTSSPSLIYWQDVTLRIMQAVYSARNQGLQVCFTVDAGPNVHLICEHDSQDEVVQFFQNIQGIKNIIVSKVGGPTHLLNEENL